MKNINSQSDLAGYWKFDEGSGTTTNDSSPFHNDGNIYGSTWATGKIGNALQFDGVNDYVEILDSSSLNITNGITLEAWVYPSTLSGWTNIIEKDQSAGYKLGLLNNEITFTLYGVWDAYSTGVVPINQWSHIAATYDR
jgi:hypothetical protein